MIETFETYLQSIAPPGTIDHTFHYRKQFAMRPGNESQKYWDLVFPRASP